ncbi:Mss4-like protein [Xylariaceae sp. FL1651]|nr:Mss4-like protein [Xylariaceae sp. FL1651]
MLTGSCMCGAVKFELTGEPTGTILCHCAPCRKCAGANGSTNLVVEPEQFRYTGKLRAWDRKGISGQDVFYQFCATCPTIVVVRPVSMDGKLIVKTGLLDSAADMEKLRPKTELFVKDRVAAWCERSSDVKLLEWQ